ncbi:alpha/beta hydrolase [Limibacter armeniacum]|uniref:alpha/beta hydrolase n=1 Tax=Limibacter armeniacum TaxID=466084 RepID=UPI002FE511FC
MNFKKIFYSLIGLFVLINILAIAQSYKFTHYASSDAKQVTSFKGLTFAEKLKTIFIGFDNPRPVSDVLPTQPFEEVIISSNKDLECWLIKAENPKGTVAIFHGFGGSKSQMLDKATIFLNQGYSVFLVDFMGSGGSEGNQTTIGYKEAFQVKSCMDYLQLQGEEDIYLFGTSMGAVAIMKAIHDYDIAPKGIMIECPFGTMYETVCARFRTVKIPEVPLASFLMFWGGVQNGFWAFGHNPVEYANSINCPTLLMYGEKDVKVSRPEIDAIYSNLKGNKELVTFPLAGHENYLIQYQDAWSNAVKAFLKG